MNQCRRRDRSRCIGRPAAVYIEQINISCRDFHDSTTKLRKDMNQAPVVAEIDVLVV